MCWSICRLLLKHYRPCRRQVRIIVIIWTNKVITIMWVKLCRLDNSPSPLCSTYFIQNQVQNLIFHIYHKTLYTTFYFQMQQRVQLNPTFHSLATSFISQIKLLWWVSTKKKPCLFNQNLLFSSFFPTSSLRFFLLLDVFFFVKSGACLPSNYFQNKNWNMLVNTL